MSFSFLVSPLSQWITFLHGYLSWQDVVEIGLLACCFNGICVWLEKDKKHNLVGYFYSYAFCIFSAYFLNLSTIFDFLLNGIPIAASLFILVHQNTLQKNFITIRNTTKLDALQTHWIDIFFQSVLHTIHAQKSLYAIIEHHDQLASLLTCTVPLNNPCTAPLLELLQKSPLFDETKMIWLNTKGTIIGINAQWNLDESNAWYQDPVNAMPLWQQKALLMTAKTDALVFHADHQTRRFWLIIHQKVIQADTAESALNYLKKYLTHTSGKKGYTHATSTIPSQKRF